MVPRSKNDGDEEKKERYVRKSLLFWLGHRPRHREQSGGARGAFVNNCEPKKTLCSQSVSHLYIREIINRLATECPKRKRRTEKRFLMIDSALSIRRH